MKRWLPALLWLFSACTEAELEDLPQPPAARDDKLAVAGEVCTSRPESRPRPVRILFVVDGSESMRVTDPPDPVDGITGRERAVGGTWQQLLDTGPPDTEVGIIRFSAQAMSTVARTDTVVEDGMSRPIQRYYTADPGLLSGGTAALAQTDRVTNYVNALGEAYNEMRSELLEMPQASLPLSKYVVIFVSDGLPDTDSNEVRENSTDNILAAVDALVELADLFRVGTFEFHTAYLSAGEGPSVDRAAQDLLKSMSERGEGTFRSFPSGESLNFLFVDFTVLRRVFTLKAISAVNMNAVVDDEQIERYLYPDPDEGGEDAGVPEMDLDAGGGMAAPEEFDGGAPADAGALAYQFTDMDRNLQPSCGEPLVDSDGDALSDMTEMELGTDPLRPDTDGDGLNDRLEWRLATSDLDPLDGDDADCIVLETCANRADDGTCDCLVELGPSSPLAGTGQCSCAEDENRVCVDDAGHDCVDMDEDGFCDCLDADMDGVCDYGDRDGDLLNNCEEVFFGTAQNGADSDADGLPDWLEARLQSNPVDRDRDDDVDFDNTLTGNEVLGNTDPWCDDSAVRSLASYRYQVDSRGLEDGRTCYTFDISNITLVPTLRNPYERYPGNGYNRILVFAGEVAFDDPDTFASYRVACVMARYEPTENVKNPPSGRIVLPRSCADGEEECAAPEGQALGLAAIDERAFVNVDEFNVDEHCIWP